MKKVLTLIVMAVAFAMPSKAQVSFGVKGGLNLTNMTIDKNNLEDLFKNKAGFFAGVTVKVGLPLVPGLAFDGAALYDQREGDIDVVNPSGNKTTEKLKSQSIQVPINVRYEIGLGESANVFIFAGPQFGFNIGDKTKSLSEFKEVSGEWTLKSSNFSANVGLGFTIMSHLQLTANYNIALGKTGEVSFKDTTSAIGNLITGDATANSWQIALAYYF